MGLIKHIYIHVGSMAKVKIGSVIKIISNEQQRLCFSILYFHLDTFFLSKELLSPLWFHTFSRISQVLQYWHWYVLCKRYILCCILLRNTSKKVIGLNIHRCSHHGLHRCIVRNRTCISHQGHPILIAYQIQSYVRRSLCIQRVLDSNWLYSSSN